MTKLRNQEATPVLPKESLLAAKRVRELSAASALQHVWTWIDEYLFTDSRDWNLEAASASDCVRLLDILKGLEWSGLDHSFREKRFDFAINKAAQKGQIEVLTWWLTKYMPERAQNAIPRILKHACWCNRMDVLLWIQRQGQYDMLDGRVNVVCQSLEIADWVFEHLYSKTIPEYYLDFRSNDGFPMLKKVYDRKVSCDIRFVCRAVGDMAAADGHLEALQWMHTYTTQYKCSSVALALAVSSGELQVVQWLCENLSRGYFDELMFGCDDIHTIEWVLSNYEWTDIDEKKTWIVKCMQRAIHWCTRKFDVVKRLVLAYPNADNGTAMESAAFWGDLQLVQRLHACGAKATPGAMDHAARKGHLSVVRWLHEFREEGCTNDAVNYAALYGHLEVIQWMHQHKSQCFTTLAMDRAACGGHLEVLEWLHLNRTEGCTTEAMYLAASFGHAKIVKYLYQHYYPDVESLKRATHIAAFHGHLKVVQFFTSRHRICLEPRQISQIIDRGCCAEAECILKAASQMQ